MGWVKDRSECSFEKIFRQLLLDAKSDVDEANGLTQGPYKVVHFEVHESGPKRFAVMRSEQTGAANVEFAFRQSHIEITMPDGKELKATPTLNADGECRLLIEGQELELWKVRRLALESLFFGPFPRQA
jgi:hypothetical protein